MIFYYMLMVDMLKFIYLVPVYTKLFIMLCYYYYYINVTAKIKLLTVN